MRSFFAAPSTIASLQELPGSALAEPILINTGQIRFDFTLPSLPSGVF
jgi:hypothetical protein